MGDRQIVHPELFAQGILTTDWTLPKGCTGSDVDVIFDNGGRFLFCEFKHGGGWEWGSLKRGQRLVYRNLVRRIPSSIACLCAHSVKVGRDINSRTDVDSFDVLFWYGRLYSTGPLPGDSWEQTVKDWFACPDEVLCQLIAEHADPNSTWRPAR